MHIPFGSLAIAPIANGNKVSFTIPYAVNNRTVSIHVDVNDNFQNKANENWSFTIDTQAPALGGISVAEYTNDSTPAISIQNAAGSPSEMALSCNGSSWKAWQAYSGTADNFSITSSSYGCLGDSEGTVTVYLKLRDLAGNESTAKNDSTTYDYRKPGTPTLDSASAGNGNVFLDWASVSDNGPSGIKDYLIYRNGTQIDTTTTTEYTATGLSNGTEYRFEIRAKDRAGNLSDYSNEKRATPSSSGSSGSGSTACSNDNSEPWLEWEFPTNNSTVSGVVRLKVRSYDDECGVRFVQFRVDDAPIGSDSTAASERYTFDWNSEKVADGTHVLKALSKSYNADETENSITKTVTVKTSNGVSKAEEEAGADNNRPAAQSAIDSAEAAKENADAVVAELASVGVLPGDGASSLISDASGLLGDAKALFGDGEYAEAVEKAEEAGAKFDEAAGMLAVEDYGEASDYVFNEEHLDILLRGMGFSQQLVDEAKAILENCGVDRSISFKQVSDGEGNYYRAVITVSVKNESGEAMDVKVVEVVPKEFAASASEIAGTGFTVIVDDPVIEWIVSLAAGEEKQVVYALKRELTAEQADAMASSGVINKFAAPPVLLNAGTDVESMFSQAPTGLFGLGGTVEIVGVAIVICAIIFFAVLYIAGRRGNGNESPFGLDAAARRAGFGSGFFDRLGRKEEPSGPKWRYRE